jgi:hypothetical protein
MDNYRQYQLEKMQKRKRNCQHRELHPVYKIKKNWWFGRKSEPRRRIMGIKFFECGNCGSQFFDENCKMPRLKKEKKK